MFSFDQLRHQQVRDLAYSCFSEPLITTFGNVTTEDVPEHCSLVLNGKRIIWLLQLDRHPAALLNYLDQLRPRRLGLYHEALWHFFLQQDEEVDLVSSNCQVRQDATTIGEFDIIYRRRLTGQYVHLELAYKLYLQAPIPASGLAQWLGPNVNDRLDRKLEHMLNHQCRLSSTDAGRQMLQSMGIQQVEREISLRGCLLHHEHPAQYADAHDLLNPDHPGGRWLPLSHVLPLLEQSEHWALLSRLQWISPLVSAPVDSYRPSDFATYLLQYFQTSDSPLMICALDSAAAERPAERFRLMVTTDRWPQLRRSV